YNLPSLTQTSMGRPRRSKKRSLWAISWPSVSAFWIVWDGPSMSASATANCLPAVFDDVQFAVADADIDGPSQTIQKALTDGQLIAHSERFLDRLGRPIDVCVSDGKLYVVEYCRQTETAGSGSDGYGVDG